MIESGLPAYELVLWTGLVAPAKTPKEITSKLNGEMVKILKTPDVREKFVAVGGDPTSSTPEQLGTHMKSEIERLAKVVKASGARVD